MTLKGEIAFTEELIYAIASQIINEIMVPV